MQLRSSMNNKAPTGSQRGMDPPLLPQIDFLQVDGRSVGRTVGRSAMMITNTDRMEWSGAEWSGDLQSTEQHQSLSRGSNGGVYQDDIYRESDDRRRRRRLLTSIGREGGIDDDDDASQLDQCRKQKWANQGSPPPYTIGARWDAPWALLSYASHGPWMGG